MAFSAPPDAEPPHAESQYEDSLHAESQHENSQHAESQHEDSQHEEFLREESLHAQPLHEEPLHEEPLHEESPHEWLLLSAHLASYRYLQADVDAAQQRASSYGKQTHEPLHKSLYSLSQSPAPAPKATWRNKKTVR